MIVLPEISFKKRKDRKEKNKWKKKENETKRLSLMSYEIRRARNLAVPNAP